MKDRLVCVIGGSGFLGRYVVQSLLQQGARVRVVARDGRDGWFLKTQSGLGQIQFASGDVRKPKDMARCIAGANAVVNLVGILKGDFQAFHVDGARNVATAAAACGVHELVHVSAIGADPNSQSAYGRSKGEGEQVVRAAFPTATILRPSIVFGREDGFVNRFADLIRMLPVVPVIRGAVKFQPVYVGDIAKAVVAALYDPDLHGGKTYDLGGPEVLSMAELNRWIAGAIGRRVPLVEIPDAFSAIMAKASRWIPAAPITQDQWLMLQSDNVVAGVDGFAAMAIVPTPLEAVADGWLVQYRRNGRFAGKTV
ncbi:complex I NDUFA9 subunit family protein [Sphingomonas sp.]|uniref:complex I NDUFA9 subunit family protein n=1 Tax=Sphingomonas sp. TaxID=28214 RepID=UPI0025E2AB0B|nr:complex I NDUFA9 subunit family protein [Sphingomonas sp.]